VRRRRFAAVHRTGCRARHGAGAPAYGRQVRPFADLPVAVDLPAPLAEEVVAAVETELGWQVVDAAGPPTPALLLCGAAAPDRPCVVVVDGPTSPEVVRNGLLAGALDVIAWPHERARLAEVPARLPVPGAAARAPAGSGLLRVVAGAAGGVGASTVALAVGALAAWSGRRALVIGGDDLLRLCGLGAWQGPGSAEVALLAPADAAAEVAVLARPVPGVGGLMVLGGGRAAPAEVAGRPAAEVAGWPAGWPAGDVTGRPAAEVAGWPADVVVADAGAAAAGDLVVARPDAGLRALVDGGGPAAPVLLIGDGPVPARTARRALGGRLIGWLPWSARVARAGLVGTVPGGLPGSWLRALRTMLGGG
jgi:hypothetical protein